VQSGISSSGIEYLRYKIEENNPSEWIRSTVDSMEPSDKYSADIMADAYEYYHNCKKAAAFFWIQKDSADEAATEGRDLSQEEWIENILFKEFKPLQNKFYENIFIPTANSQVSVFLNDSSIPEQSKARFLSASFEHAGKWLASVPRDDFRMTSSEFRTSMQLRLGINNLSGQSLCSCGNGIADDHQHLLNCHKGNQISNRHGAIVTYFCDLLKEAGQLTTSEEHLADLQISESSPRSDFTIKRQDIITGRPNHQHYDVTVVNPSAATYIAENKSHQVNGATANRAYQQKMRKYSTYVDPQDFHPLVFETYGYWRPEVTELIHKCCKLIEEKGGVAYSVLVNYWISKLSFILQWENAITILERIDAAAMANGHTQRKNFRRINSRIK
jgi:hypothetical protein